MENGIVEKTNEKARPKTIWKKWLIIAIIAVLVIIIAVPSGFALSLHNSTYDCSYIYSTMDNPLTEIARKSTYYNAGDKTLEIELNQDMINSLLKDNFDSLNLNLPVTIKEIMFNTKDQRLYINARYGKLNVPLSIKITVKTSDDGLAVQGEDIKLGNMDAPGFLMKQISKEDLQYTIKYADFDLPPVFNIKDIKFGSGIVKATIQLLPDKIVEMAMDYRNDLVTDINKIKTEQPEVVGTFLTKVLGTDVLSDAKVKNYVEQLLGNEEIVNSAIYFATASDLNKYTVTLQETQKKIEEWAAPLQNIKYYGSIDETVNNVLYDQKLRELLSWFVPAETMNEVTVTVEDYYGMYKEYYGMYEDILASIDSAVAGIDTKQINEFTSQILEYTAQADDARLFFKEGIQQLDDKTIADLVYLFEKDEKYAEGYITDLIDTRDATDEFLSKSYDKEVNEFNNIVKGRNKFIIDVIRQLRNRQYEEAVAKIANDGIIDRKTKAFVEKYSKEIEMDTINTYMEKYGY